LSKALTSHLNRISNSLISNISKKDFQKHLSSYKAFENQSTESNNKPIGTVESTSNNHSPKKEPEADNPFLIIEKNKEENLEFVLEILQEITAKKNLCKLEYWFRMKPRAGS
jgi:hypothetical protein